MDDSDFQDRTPVQEGINLQDLPSRPEGAQGWFDVETATPPSDQGDAVNSDSEASEHSVATLRRSNRIRRPVERLAYAVTLLCPNMTDIPSKWESHNEIFSMSSLCPNHVIPDMGPEDLMAYAISNDPDTLTYKEAMSAPDKDKFVESMAKELQGQLDMGVLHPVLCSSVPKTATV